MELNIKLCTKCGIEKTIASFSKKPDSKDGLRSQCKQCLSIAGSEYYSKNSDKILKRHMNYRMENAEAIKASISNWRGRNSEKLSQKAVEYRLENLEKLQAYRRSYYQKNKEKERVANAAWAEKNQEKKKASVKKWAGKNLDQLRIRNQNYQAKKRSNGGILSKGLADKLFALQQGKCACCSKDLGDNYHLDHIVPIALGGLNVDSNIQLLSQRCNSQKGKKHPVEFMQSRGFLL